MRAVVSALIILGLFWMVACDSNDENTINSIAKYHDADPTFHIMVDNGYLEFPVDSVRMYFEPYSPGFQIDRTFYDTTTYKYFHKEVDQVGNLLYVVDSVRDVDVAVSSATFDIPSFGNDDVDAIPIYSDSNGFIGILGSGTYVADIHFWVDTVTYEIDTLAGSIIGVDTTYAADTTSGNHHMTPGQVYNITLVRENDFEYTDYLKIVHSVTIDSLWLLRSADTVLVSVIPDINETPVVVLDSVGIIIGTPSITPDSEIYEPAWFGEYNDTAFIALKVTDDTMRDSMNIDDDLWSFWKVFYDTVYLDSVRWGFWEKTDSFFVAADSAFWCTGDSVHVVEIDTTRTHAGFSDDLVRADTTWYYFDCDDTYLDEDSMRTVVYNDYIWGIYPGGDVTQTPKVGYDTTEHFAILDSSKTISLLSNYLVEITNNTSGVTRQANLYLDMYSSLDPDSFQTLDSLKFNIVIPPKEVYPDFNIIIRDEN